MPDRAQRTYSLLVATRIVAHAEDKKDLVEGFNAAMRAGGSRWGFYVDPVPQWIPPREGQKAHREFYLAIENDARCVGAYALKPQRWSLDGEEVTITDWQGPVSLGAVNPKYAALGLRLVRDMLKKQPLLYSWGHGSDETPMTQMLTKMGWLMHATPFLFRVCKPSEFLRKNRYLRKDPKRAAAQGRARGDGHRHRGDARDAQAPAAEGAPQSALVRGRSAR